MVFSLFPTFIQLYHVLESKHRSGGILKKRGGGCLNPPVAMVTPQRSKLGVLPFNTIWFLQFSDFYSKWPPPTRSPPTSFILFWKVTTVAVVSWQVRHNRGSPVTMVTLQMSKGGFLPRILTLWCLAFFRLFFKMTPLQHRGGSPPTSFILFWKLNTVAVVSWKNGGGGGRLNLPVAMVTPQSSRYYCLTLWFLQFSDFYSKWPPPTTPGRVPSFILFWKVDTPSVVPWKGKVKRLSDSLPILEETLDTRVLYIMKCWPDMGFVPTKKVDVQTTLHFCSDQTYISRATYIPSEQFKQLLLNLRHWAYKVFRLFSLLTTNDLWPPWKNRGHLFTKGYLHTKFVVQATFPSSDIVFTKFPGFDLCWPQMTFELHEKQ